MLCHVDGARSSLGRFYVNHLQEFAGVEISEPSHQVLAVASGGIEAGKTTERPAPLIPCRNSGESTPVGQLRSYKRHGLRLAVDAPSRACSHDTVDHSRTV